MKKRTLALVLTGALALSLLGATALAAEGGTSVPDTSAVPSEEPAAQAREETSPAAEPAPPEAEPSPEGTEDSDELPVEEYIPDPVGSLSFANLERRMHEGNLQILALQESIDMIEELDYDQLKQELWEQVNALAKAQWQLVLGTSTLKYMSEQGVPGASYSEYDYRTVYDQLDRAYDAVRKQYDAIKEGDMQEDNADTVRQLKNLQNQIVVAGEATYVALAAMELQEGALERQLAALDRQITELELRYQLGHISSMTLKQAKSGRAALSSGLSTLRMNLNTYKGQLELLIGADITGEISLSALPAVTQKDLDGLDLEQDLETAKENSWDIYQATETMKEDLKTYNSHGGEAAQPYMANKRAYQQARHTWYAAKYTYDNTIQSFELNLRNMYLRIMDYKQVLDAAKTALAVEQDNYAAAQLKQSQGNLSRNGLLEAEDKLKEAREKVAGAENDLFSAYNTYRWAVDYGIMN